MLPGYDVFADTHQVLRLHPGLEKCRRLRSLCGGGIRESLALRGEILLLLTDLMPQEPEVVSARMAEALLLTGETLQLLTDEYGFCDGYYLSACFKRYMDVSPLKYRALHQIS